MKLAIVGPTHPYKGGIAQQTTELAHRLTAQGHQVDIISWRAQYPFFYPGSQFVPNNQPELPVFAHSHRVLSWKNPGSWWRWGRKLRSYDRVILVWWVPTFQGPVYLTMLQALGRSVPTTLLCHNVLPHEAKPGDKALTRRVLRRVNEVVVHTDDQAKLVQQLANRSAKVAALPLVLPNRPTAKHQHQLRHQLLFFGIVRPYKGLDVLLQALAKVTKIQLTIAGEFWGGTEQYEALIKQLHLSQRVTILPGYVPADQLAKLLTTADALVLPYRHGTGTQHVSMAHAYGTPVIASATGSIPSQVRDGKDGLLCQPGDAADLAQAINYFYEDGIAQKLRRGVPQINLDADWQAYIKTLL